MSEIYCPFCKRKMVRVESNEGQTLWHHWNCSHCETIFEIRQMPWYPIKKKGE